MASELTTTITTTIDCIIAIAIFDDANASRRSPTDAHRTSVQIYTCRDATHLFYYTSLH